jgi:membrane associated rhomboid family serine protease
MMSLFFLGGLLERIIGRKRFLFVYMASGIIAALFFVLIAYLFNLDMSIPAVGASGAIFGVAGMLAVLTPKMPVYIFFIPVAVPMWFGVILILALLWGISAAFGVPIGNLAHLGGLLVGVIFAFYLKFKYPRKTRMISNHFR